MKHSHKTIYNHYDLTEDNDEDGSVDIVVSEEVEVVFGFNLSICSESNQESSNESKDAVADDHEVFDETLAASFHDEADFQVTLVKFQLDH